MNKKELAICKKDGFLDKVTLDTTELMLLATGDGVEIMNQSIDQGVMFQVSPATKDNIIEFFYVLEGELECQKAKSDDVRILSVGDSFYSQNLVSNYAFRTITSCRLLYVSSEPIFHLIGDKMKQMHVLNSDLDIKDSYTKGHSERVHKYSLDIALEMGLDREIMLKIALAALFHDVGKIDIPTYILKKGDALTDSEYDTIRLHPIKGANLVKDISYKNVSHIVAQHHERIDGSGYPMGLKGNDICLEARVIAVADSYDAMTSDRPYRASIPEEMVVQEINNYSGIWYDDDVVEAFNSFIRKKNKSKG